jgi:iron complex outermembrane receptor protein
MQYEVGLRAKPLAGLDTTLRGYYYDVDDYIRTIFGYKPSRVVYNIDRVEFLGLEGEVTYRFTAHLSCFANVTYEETKKKGDILDNSNQLTDKLPEIPEWKFNLGARYARKDGTLVKVTYRWVDDRAIPVNSTTFKPLGSGCPSGACTLGKIDAYGVVNVYLRYPFLKKRVKGYLIAGCNNLFDERYEETYGYPMPNRMWFAGLKFDY